MATEQLFLLGTDVVRLRPVLMGDIRPTAYWVCTCGRTLQHNQVIPHLCNYHFYSLTDARYLFRQAKLGLEQNTPTLVNLLSERR